MSKKRCYICDSRVTNDLELGEFQNGENNISVHYFCLLVTSNLVQNGDDDEGILGFLTEDIEAEVERIKRLKCYYCKKSKANIGCCLTRCRRTFHTLCGLKNDALLQFEDPYRGFCHDHIPNSKPKRKHNKTERCTICYEEMGNYHKINSILSPCCKTHWFHKICLMQFAKSAGYFFKCPLCNNSDKFRTEIKLKGIFVPDRDAIWELEPNAFAELQDVNESCMANECLCPNGRDWDESEFSISRCTMCGSCFHIQCSSNGNNHSKTICDSNSFVCGTCVLPTVAAATPQSPTLTNENDERPLSSRVQSIEAIDLPSSSNSSSSSTSSPITVIDSHASNGVDTTKTIKVENASTRSRNKQQDLKNSQNSSALLSPNMSTLSDVEIIENKVEYIYISSTSSDDDDNADDNIPLLTLLGRNDDKKTNVSTKTKQRTKAKKRSYPQSPIKNDVTPPPVVNKNKKIKKTIEICKNQSKITSFFSLLGSKSEGK